MITFLWCALTLSLLLNAFLFRNLWLTSGYLEELRAKQLELLSRHVERARK